MPPPSLFFHCLLSAKKTSSYQRRRALQGRRRASRSSEGEDAHVFLRERASEEAQLGLLRAFFLVRGRREFARRTLARLWGKKKFRESENNKQVEKIKTALSPPTSLFFFFFLSLGSERDFLSCSFSLSLSTGMRSSLSMTMRSTSISSCGSLSRQAAAPVQQQQLLHKPAAVFQRRRRPALASKKSLVGVVTVSALGQVRPFDLFPSFPRETKPSIDGVPLNSSGEEYARALVPLGGELARSLGLQSVCLRRAPLKKKKRESRPLPLNRSQPSESALS